MWFENAVFYQMYPLTLCGCPLENPAPAGSPFSEESCIDIEAASAKMSEDAQKYASGSACAGEEGCTGGEGCPRPHRIQRLKAFIPHMKLMGITGVYLNPVMESDTHGYDTRDYRMPDRRLGSKEDLRDFVDACHKAGIRVVFDGVFNHVGRGFWAFRDVQEKKWESPYKDWFCINFDGDSGYHDGFWYEGWQGHYELVKLNLNNPQVQNYLMESIDSWYEDYDIDGIRLDVAYLLPTWFVAMVKDRIRAKKEDSFLLAEILGDNAGRFYTEGHVDAITDYPLYKAIWSSFNSYNMFELAHTLKRSYDEMYRGRQLYSFVDNHDVDRIASKIEDKRKLVLAYGLLLTLPGIPQIYYGSEWGLEGRKGACSDAELRPALLGPESTFLTDRIRSMCIFRKYAPELGNGSYRQLLLTNRLFAFEREKDGNRTCVVINIDDAPAMADLPGGSLEILPRSIVFVRNEDKPMSIF